MPFRAIRGTFHVAGYAPDGRSVRFAAEDGRRWTGLAGPPVALDRRGRARLRFEAIDPVETRYRDLHQPVDAAHGGFERLLAALGVQGAVLDARRGRVVTARDAVPGWVLTRGADRLGRPIAFAFAGDIDVEDGDAVYLREPLMARSVNRRLLDAGAAYPSFYRGLFSDLRLDLARAVAAARAAGVGLWPRDRTSRGVAVTGLGAITERHVILPKLFRRLVDHLEAGGTPGNFRRRLAAAPEPVLVVPGVQFTHFDDVVDVEGERVRLVHAPEDLVFLG